MLRGGYAGGLELRRNPMNDETHLRGAFPYDAPTVLTNQSRYTPAAAGSAARNDRGAGRRPWEEPGPADEYFT